MTITTFLGNIASHVINPIIILGFVIATVFLFYSIIVLIAKADSNDLAKNKQNVMYGVLGLFIMFSVYGILRLVLATLNITCSGFFC